jgi:hypothetical protein
MRSHNLSYPSKQSSGRSIAIGYFLKDYINPILSQEVKMTQIDHRGYFLPQDETTYIHCEIEKTKLLAILDKFGTDYEQTIKVSKTAAINRALDLALKA